MKTKEKPKIRWLPVILITCVVFATSFKVQLGCVSKFYSSQSLQTISRVDKELHDPGIASKQSENISVIRVFIFFSAISLLGTGIIVSPAFENIVRIAKQRPQMARKSLNSEDEHLF